MPVFLFEPEYFLLLQRDALEKIKSSVHENAHCHIFFSIRSVANRKSVQRLH